MALRILAGALAPTERGGRATILFHPHNVVGDADLIEPEETGPKAEFTSRPRQMVAVRQFRPTDDDTFWGGGAHSKERVQIVVVDGWNTERLEVTWSGTGKSSMSEIAYLIIGEARDGETRDGDTRGAETRDGETRD